MVNSSKCFGQCNHIRAKSILVSCPKQSLPADGKCNEPEEIVLAKCKSFKVVAQSVGKVKQTAALPCDLHMCPQTTVSWSYIDLSLAGGFTFEVAKGTGRGLMLMSKYGCSIAKISVLAMESGNFGDPKQSSALPLLRGSEKIEGGTSVRNPG
ncbi:hypothetical protein ACTXT7_004850 [Hymenolepis weldensis]